MYVNTFRIQRWRGLQLGTIKPISLLKWSTALQNNPAELSTKWVTTSCMGLSFNFLWKLQRTIVSEPGTSNTGLLLCKSLEFYTTHTQRKLVCDWKEALLNNPRGGKRNNTNEWHLQANLRVEAIWLRTFLVWKEEKSTVSEDRER